MGKEETVVFFNRERFVVPKEITYLEFRALIGIPPARKLYLKQGRHYTEVTESNFNLRAGQHYIDIPDWVEGEAETPLPPLLAADLSELRDQYGSENVQIERLDSQNWVVVLSGFPLVPGFRGQSGECTVRIPIVATYPQSAINGINITLPTGEVVNQCYNCQSWNPNTDSIQTYLCAVQRWMEVKPRGQ